MLPQIEAIQKETAAAAAAKKAGSGTLVDTLGLTSATEQLPRMIRTTVPSATEALGMATAVYGTTVAATTGAGAATGAAIGTVAAPGPGTVAGGAGGAVAGFMGGQPGALAAGTAAGSATYVARQTMRSYEQERNTFAADLATQKDTNGQALDPALRNAAAHLYGLTAAAIEGTSEAMFLKLLKPVGGAAIAEKFGQEGVGGFVKSALRRAVLDTSVRARLLEIGAKVAGGAVLEGMEEGLQEIASILTEYGAKELAAGQGDTFFAGNELFTRENAAQVAESFTEAFRAGIWLQGGPIAVSNAARITEAREANRFAERYGRIHEKVEATKTKALSPDYMAEALEHAGERGMVHVPADAALELYQQGTDILTPFGISPEQAERGAALGHAFEVPMSQVLARLDTAQFQAAAQIFRQAPGSMSTMEAAGLDLSRVEDAGQVLELYQSYKAEDADYQTERARLHEGFTRAIEAVPGLKAQAEGMAGGVSAYLDHALALADAALPRLAALSGESRASVLARIVPQMLGATPSKTPLVDAVHDANAVADMEAAGFVFDDDAQALPAVDAAGMAAYEATLQQRFERQHKRSPLAERDPVLAHVWGRLDGKSLKAYDAHGYKDIRAARGMGLFRSAEKGGQSLDLLADELARSGMLPEGSGANELLAYLKGEGLQLHQADFPAALEYGRRVKEAAQKWGEQVKAFFAGTLHRRTIMQLGQTSDILQRVGLPDLPLVMGHDIARKVTGQGKKQDAGHQLTEEQLAALVEELANPVMVLHAPNGYFLAVTDLWVNDAPVMVAIAPDAEQGRIQVNDIRSAYGKDKFTGWLLGETEKGNLLYLNKKRSATFKDRSGLQLPRVLEKQRSSGKKIIYDTDVVKPEYENGLELHHSQNGTIRGSTAIHDNAYYIRLMQRANLSTLPHEFSHVFLLEWQRVMDSGVTDAAARADWQAARKWLGATDGAAFTREQHEQFARGFEAYLMEGKTPAPELAGTFARFKRWLLAIYKDAKGLGVELNDEIRGVFDRMLATEQQIEEAAAVNELYNLTEAQLDALGVTGKDRVYAAGLMDIAKTRGLAKMQEDLDKERGARLKAWAAEATEELSSDKVYVARSELYGKQQDGEDAGPWLDVDAVRESFGDAVAADLRKALGGFALRAGGQDPEIMAARHGFISSADLISSLVVSESKAKRIKALVVEKEAAFEAARAQDMNPAGYILEAEEAVAQVEFVGRYLAKAIGKSSLSRQAFAQVATDELDGMNMGKAVSQPQFLAALRRALRDERRAVASGDFYAALEANHKARLNLEFVRQSRDIERLQQKTTRQISRFVGMGKADPDARYLVMDVAMRHGLGKYNARLAEGREATTPRDWLAARDADGYALFVDDAVLLGPGKPWKEMTAGEFTSLAETVAQVVAVERNARQVSTAQGKMELDALAEEIAGTLLVHNKQREQKILEDDSIFVSAIDAVNYSLTKIEILCMKLDGQRDGPLWQNIYKRVSDAEDKKALRLRDARKALDALYSMYSPKEQARLAKDKIFIRSGNEFATKEKILSVALNMGTDINNSRLLESGMTEDYIAEVLSHMSVRDWNFVKGMWKYIGSFKEEAFALEKRMTGIVPKGVEARPFVIQTSDGTTVTIPGGYYPIAYDPAKSDRVQELEDKELAADLFGTVSSTSAMTTTGHLKERAKCGLGVPLLWKLRVADTHIYNVVHDIEMREAILDAAKVLRNGKVKAAIIGSVGQKGYRAFMPWLRDIARERQDPKDYLDSIFRWMRNSTAMMAMGFKAGTGLLQVSGLAVSTKELSLQYMARGLSIVYGGAAHVNPFAGAQRMMAIYERTCAISPFMAGRMKSWSREVKDASTFVTKGRGVITLSRRHAFDLIGIAQMGVDLPTWWGAYEQGLSRYGGDEAKAIAHADRTVRIAQGAGGVKDLSAIQRGGEKLKILTMFYSWFNTMYNLASLTKTDVQHAETTSEKVGHAAGFLFWCWFGTQAIEVALDAMRGRTPDDDDDDEKAWAKYLGGKFIGFWTGMIPFERDVANAFLSERDYALSPVQGFVGALLRAAKAGANFVEDSSGDAAKKLAVGATRALGYASGTPLEPVAQTIKTVWDYMDGTTPELEIRKVLLR